ncbi:phosphatase PAP2 family protein [Pseudalkalibacillus hwajinpoensis]|uniref:phosphatase PAP2 family protein n=1 Tax=Guptibacillus hwajinpoensis TaxID=208199 RepID=UPI00325B5D49
MRVLILVAVAIGYVILFLIHPFLENSLDRSVLTLVTRLETPELTQFCEFLSFIGSIHIQYPILIALFAVIGWKRPHQIILLMFNLLGVRVITLMLKSYVERARPVEMLIDAGGYSFPSGHAMITMAFYGYMFYLAYRKERWILIPGVLLLSLIGFSRIYLRVHYMSDVLAGWCAGGFWLSLTIIILHWFNIEKSTR